PRRWPSSATPARPSTGSWSTRSAPDRRATRPPGTNRRPQPGRHGGSELPPPAPRLGLGLDGGGAQGRVRVAVARGPLPGLPAGRPEGARRQRPQRADRLVLERRQVVGAEPPDLADLRRAGDGRVGPDPPGQPGPVDDVDPLGPA